MTNALDYVSKNGISLESNYPYKGRDGTCSYKEEDKAFQNKDFEIVPSSDSDQLKLAASKGVVAVGVDFGGIIQLYFGGVFNLKWACGTNIDHGVTLVGYDHAWLGGDYWLIKNSWGMFWGEGGYIRLKRESGKGVGICGVTEMASYPTA